MKYLNVPIASVVPIPKPAVCRLLSSVLAAHYEVIDDNGSVSSQAYAWRTVAEAGLLPVVIESAPPKVFRQVMRIVFPDPMTPDQFMDFATALANSTLDQLILLQYQHTAIVKWAEANLGSAVMQAYDTVASDEAQKRQQHKLMTIQHARALLEESGWTVQPPQRWHEDRRGSRKGGDRRAKPEVKAAVAKNRKRIEGDPV